MLEREIKLLFRTGHLQSCRALPVSMVRGWNLKFRTRDNQEEILTLQRSGTEREFKTLDAAVAVARRIGFEWLNVELGALKWQEKVAPDSDASADRLRPPH